MNTALESVFCGANGLSTIDVGNNIHLKQLHIGDNQIVNIDVSNNPALIFFACSQNLLTRLDVSANNSLTTLNCLYNPNLSCIQVNNSQFNLIPSGWVKPAAANYSENCN
jgi:hypothetical protein